MNFKLSIKIATGVALIFAFALTIFEPSFEPLITSLTLAIALAILFFEKRVSELPYHIKDSQLVIDGSPFLGNSSSMKKLP
jgi:hypothetical protein